MADDTLQSVLFVSRNCHVYKLPPRSSTAGYKASEWSVDGTGPLWTGRLRIVEVSKLDGSETSTCEIRMEDANTGELFANCPYSADGKAVEAVLDSSRYFVLAVVDPGSGRRAFLGMGFPERTEAFDFNVALQDWARQQHSQSKAGADAAAAGPSPHLPASGAKDFSLKPGESISIAIGGSTGRKSTTSNLLGASSGGNGAGAIPFLPPPPSAADVKKRSQ